jgi:hypothetical protein
MGTFEGPVRGTGATLAARGDDRDKIAHMRLAAERSRIAVYTFAEGLLSALAHDLELVAGDVTGEANETAEGTVAEVRVRVASLRATGVMKRGKLDVSVLSASDRDAIDRQVREDVLPGGDVVARATSGGQGSRVAIEVRSARGVDRVTCDLALTKEEGDDDEGGARRAVRAVRAKGRAEVSLSALGSPPVKGPMGAFRVKDRVRVELDLLFTP